MELSNEYLWEQATQATIGGDIHIIKFARAIEAEVRKQDEALIRQLVGALEGYRRNHNDTQPCDAERAGRAWLEGKK